MMGTGSGLITEVNTEIWILVGIRHFVRKQRLKTKRMS